MGKTFENATPAWTQAWRQRVREGMTRARGMTRAELDARNEAIQTSTKPLAEIAREFAISPARVSQIRSRRR